MLTKINKLFPGDTIKIGDNVYWEVIKSKGQAKGIKVWWKVVNTTFGPSGEVSYFSAIYNANCTFDIQNKYIDNSLIEYVKTLPTSVYPCIKVGCNCNFIVQSNCRAHHSKSLYYEVGVWEFALEHKINPLHAFKLWFEGEETINDIKFIRTTWKNEVHKRIKHKNLQLFVNQYAGCLANHMEKLVFIGKKKILK